jgi:hypothetical protein
MSSCGLINIELMPFYLVEVCNDTLVQEPDTVKHTRPNAADSVTPFRAADSSDVCRL